MPLLSAIYIERRTDIAMLPATQIAVPMSSFMLTFQVEKARSEIFQATSVCGSVHTKLLQAGSLSFPFFSFFFLSIRKKNKKRTLWNKL